MAGKLTQQNKMNKQTVFELPFFALGFRAFFFCAGISALVLLALWKAMYSGALILDNYYPISYWHAHEMLLGYTAAVIAGFLLTAVRNWTSQPTLDGVQLAGLCLLWVYGRVLPFYAGLLPNEIIALCDFSFLAILSYQIGRSIWKAKHLKSVVFVVILLLIMLGNALIHAEMLKYTEQTASIGIKLVMGVVILLILVIAGKIFPFFTERALKGVHAIRDPLLDVLSVVSAALVFILDIFDVAGLILAISASLAAMINTLRLSGWFVQRVIFVPLLWVLYVGYAWVIVGFILTALSAYSLVLPTLALHAFTMGGIGVLTLGMMSRVSLGHTGRALKVSNVMTIGFLLINMAVFVRIFLPIALTAWYEMSIIISIGCWLIAFFLFVFVYSPILVGPRVDGKPG